MKDCQLILQKPVQNWYMELKNEHCHLANTVNKLFLQFGMTCPCEAYFQTRQTLKQSIKIN